MTAEISQIDVDAAAQAKVCRSLVAPTHAALQRLGLNNRHWLLVCDVINVTLAQGRLAAVFKNRRELGGLRNWDDATLAAVLNGYRNSAGKWVAGLVELGIISMRDVPEGLLVEMNPNWPRWEWKEMHSASQRNEWVAAVNARTDSLARQELSPEIEERFALAALLAAGNAENALEMARGDHVVAAAPTVQDDEHRRGGTVLGVARPSCVGDARKLPTEGGGRASPSRTSQNAKSSFTKCEASRPRAALSLGTKSSQSALSSLTLSVEELKNLLRSGEEKDFVAAMQAIIPTHERGDGGKWRAKWRVPELRTLVVAMFEGIVEKIAEGKIRRPAALEAHWYWHDFGGLAVEEKLRNLLIKK